MQKKDCLKVAVFTHGCRLNQAESNTLASQFEALPDYKIVDWNTEADLYVVNSCTVTRQADLKCDQLLRSIRQSRPAAKIAVIGCYAQTSGKAIYAKRLADLVLGQANKFNLTKLVDQQGVFIDAMPRHVFSQPQAAHNGLKTREWLKIQDGCDFMCTYCIIPSARGRARSRRFGEIIAEAEAFAAVGVKEVVITGVNIGTYAQDGQNLTNLIDRLDAISGLCRIRISSIEPMTFPEALFERMQDSRHGLLPFLHLPLQSGSQAVLGDMRRHYTPAEYEQLAQRALSKVDNLFLGTDVIVGFPTEDDAAFQESYSFVRSLPFGSLHIFPYSSRKGSRSYYLSNPNHGQITKERAQLMRQLNDQMQASFQVQQVGRTEEVLFEGYRQQGLSSGLTKNNLRITCTTERNLRGEILPVRLLKVANGGLSGELLDSSSVT